MSTWVSLIIWLARWAYRVGPRLSGAVSVEARSVTLGLRLALWKCGWCLSLAGLACAHSVRFGGGSVPCQDHVSCKKHVQGTEPGRPPDPRPAPPTPPQTPGVEPRSCRTASHTRETKARASARRTRRSLFLRAGSKQVPCCTRTSRWATPWHSQMHAPTPMLAAVVALVLAPVKTPMMLHHISLAECYAMSRREHCFFQCTCPHHCR